MLGTMRIVIRHITTKALLVLSNKCVEKTDLDTYLQFISLVSAPSYLYSYEISVGQLEASITQLCDNKIFIKGQHITSVTMNTVEDYLLEYIKIMYLYETSTKGTPYSYHELYSILSRNDEKIRKVIRKAQKKPLAVKNAITLIINQMMQVSLLGYFKMLPNPDMAAFSCTSVNLNDSMLEYVTSIRKKSKDT